MLNQQLNSYKECTLTSPVTPRRPAGLAGAVWDCAPQDASQSPRVLIVGPIDRRLEVSAMLISSGWTVNFVGSLLDAMLISFESPAAVIITSYALPDGGWKDVLNYLGQDESAPRIIVAARFADERLWAEVLNRGGFDLLPQPFELGSVARTVESAYQDWRTRAAA